MISKLILLMLLTEHRIEYISLPNQGPFRVVKNAHINDLKKVHIINTYMDTNTYTHIQTTADQIKLLIDHT